MILVVEPLTEAPWIWFALRIISRTTRSHRNKVILGTYSERLASRKQRAMTIAIDLMALGDAERIYRFCMEKNPDPYWRAACILKAELVLGVLTANRMFIGSIALLRPRNLCSLIGITGILAMNPLLAVEALPARRAYNIIAMNPLYGLTEADILAGSIVQNLYDETPCRSSQELGLYKEIPVYRDLEAILLRSPEMIYSSTEALERILGAWDINKCKICGAPSREDLCEICSELVPLANNIPNPSG